MTKEDMFEILKSKYNVIKETNKIINLLSEAVIFENSYKGMAAEEIVDEYLLRYWAQRGSYLSCQEIKEDLEINDKIDDKTSNKILIITLQYYTNILNLVKHNLNRIFQNSALRPTNLFLIVMDNLRILLDHLNYEEKYIEEEQKTLLIPKILPQRLLQKFPPRKQR